MKRMKCFLFIVIVLTFGLTACGGKSSTSGNSSEKTNDKEITIGYIPWDEDVAVTNLWKKMLEDKGYKVKIVQADVAPIFSGVAQGNIDLFLDVWMPTTHKSYMERFGNKLEVLNTWYNQADSGLAVPDYVDAKTIEDLKKYKKDYGGKIISIEPGSGINDLTKEGAMPGYGLKDWQLVESSTPAMLSELGKAVSNKQPIVVTLWRPHWAFEKYNLRYLEDPKSFMNPTGPEKIQIISSKKFKADYPEVASWLQDFKMTEEQLAKLESYINELKDETKAVEKWMSENKSVLEAWTK